MSSPRRGHEGSFWRRNGLSLACFGFFLVFWAGQILTGWQVRNDEARSQGVPAISLVRYVTTGHFAEATFENWESEFLQMGAFVVLTTRLVQRGSSESKSEEEVEAEAAESSDSGAADVDPDAPWPVHRGGLWLRLYANSLGLAFAGFFLLSSVGHALGGVREYNSERIAQGEPAVSLARFVTSSQFWFQSFQNWQSEFLAVGAIVVFTIFLRQKGSPESKPVDAPNWRTG